MNIIFLSLIALIISAAICLLHAKRFYKNVTDLFCLEQTKSSELYSALLQNNQDLTKYKNNFEHSFIKNTKIYNDFLDNLDYEALESLKFMNLAGNAQEDDNNDNHNNYVNIVELIEDCKIILYPELHKNKVECIVNITANKNIKIDNPSILSIMLINFMCRALDRTPNNNSILVALEEEQDCLIIKIEDTGIDISYNKKNSFKEFILFSLPDNILFDLAKKINVNIQSISSGEQNHSILLKIKINPNLNSNITQVDNVFHVPQWK